MQRNKISRDAALREAQDIQEFLSLVIESGKNLVQRAVVQMAVNRFTQHATEVSSDSEIAAFI